MYDKQQNLREIEQALQAGTRAQNSLAEAQSKLSGARGFGIWDMLGGGFISGLLKHSSLDGAQRCLEQAQRDLDIFRRELSDVYIDESYSVAFDGISKFLDLFVDNIFVDVILQSKIKDAQAKMEQTKRQVDDAMRRLWDLKSQVERS